MTRSRRLILDLYVTAVAAAIFAVMALLPVGCDPPGVDPDAQQLSAASVTELADVTQMHRPQPDCASDSYLTCSIMSARIRNKLVNLGCTFHPIFTALYSFHCAFFAGEPTRSQQESCTRAIGSLTCGDDGVVTLDDLPAECTTQLGLPVEIRW